MSALEQRLIALGHALEVPDAPDVAPRVLAEIGERRPGRPARQRLVVTFALVAAAALVATLAIPDARSALLRFLQIGGAQIEVVDDLPPVPQTPPELELTLGKRVPLGEARRTASFDLLELEQAPDAVFIGDRGTVWFEYGRPDAVKLLVAQTPSITIDEPFILKKLVSSGTTVEETAVRGEPAYFLSGAPHVVLLLDEFGIVHEESARLAHDVLLWEVDGRTVRLEGEFSRDEAVEIAESLG